MMIDCKKEIAKLLRAWAMCIEGADEMEGSAIAEIERPLIEDGSPGGMTRMIPGPRAILTVDVSARVLTERVIELSDLPGE